MARVLLTALVLAACGGHALPPPAPAAAPEPAPVARDELPPWAARPLQLGEVEQAYLSEWQRAANKDQCPLLVITDVGVGAGAAPRRIDFGVGWGVAYDKHGLPGTSVDGRRCDSCGRSAFGVAGTASTRGASAPTHDQVYRWNDGSVGRRRRAEGQGVVLYLEVAGVQCVYNVWSAVGEDHLRRLLAGLRRVDGM